MRPLTRVLLFVVHGDDRSVPGFFFDCVAKGILGHFSHSQFMSTSQRAAG